MTRSPGLIIRDIRATAADHAGGLMAVDSGRRQQIVFDFLEIGVADAAGFHPNQNLAGANFGRVDLVDGNVLSPR